MSPMTVVHLTDGWVRPDGSVNVQHWTNDNEDRGYTGYAGDIETWEENVKDLGTFQKRFGKCRTGWAGARVIVRLDGKEVKE